MRLRLDARHGSRHLDQRTRREPMRQSSEMESIVRPMMRGLHRRQVLSLGLRLGLAAPVIAELMAGAAEAYAAAQDATPSAQAAQSSGTFTVLATGAIATLDPHVAY